MARLGERRGCPHDLVVPQPAANRPVSSHQKRGGGRHTTAAAGSHRERPASTLALARGRSDDRYMRYESCITSLSWIPSEAVTAGPGWPSTPGFTHYDDPPPGQLDDLEALRATDRFRFANVLRAWIEVDGAGTVTGCGYDGGGLMGATTVRLGALSYRFQAVRLPDLQREPERGDGWVRFVQTVGGRTGLPAPRRVRRKPFVQWQAPLVWTTLSLTLHADGTAESAMTGASPFPRHWVYDAGGSSVAQVRADRLLRLVPQVVRPAQPVGRRGLGGPGHGGGDRAGTRAVGAADARRGQAEDRRLKAGEVLVRQGEPGTDVYLVLDGVVRVEHDGERLAEYGPGAMLGERAHLEGGTRTSTLVAVTACRVAAVDAGQLDRSALEELSAGHRREEAAAPASRPRGSEAGPD